MKAFLKTLIGDTRNLSVVAAIIVIELALIFAGQGRAAAFVIPPLTLAGVTVLAIWG